MSLAYTFAVSAGRGFLRRELGDFALVHLLGLLDAQANGPAEVLHEDLGLLHLGRVHLGAHHRTEGNLLAFRRQNINQTTMKILLHSFKTKMEEMDDDADGLDWIGLDWISF